MRPPPLPLLQACNALANLAAFLAFSAANSLWSTGHHWSAWQCGIALASANVVYALTAAFGGRLADRAGRGFACIAGAGVCALGCALPALSPEPIPALIGLWLAVGGTALYFPGCAGLFSDAEAAAGARAIPLHAKVNQYNLGWSTGILGGFAVARLLAGLRYDVLFAVAAGVDLTLFAVLFRWRRLPPSPPTPLGDRAPHPALPLLTLTGRGAMLIGALAGMGIMSQLEPALDHLLGPRAREVTSGVLCAYPAGYIVMYLLLGRWGGWVLRPWRLWLLQLGMPLGALLFLALARSGDGHAAPLMVAAALIGSGFGGAYVSSIYYSLRLPDNAARAAGLHETCIGVGNTLGPTLAGLFVSGWTAPGAAPNTALTGLAAFVLMPAAAMLLWQALLIPRAMRAR